MIRISGVQWTDACFVFWVEGGGGGWWSFIYLYQDSSAPYTAGPEHSVL